MASDFWTRLMSGTDNQTPAIGRYLGALLFLIFLLMLPVVVLTALWLSKADWTTYKELFPLLAVYVPAIVGSIIALIRVTHPTEPTQAPPQAVGQ